MENAWECVPVSAEYMWIMCLFVLICAKLNSIYKGKLFIFPATLRAERIHSSPGFLLNVTEVATQR